MPALAPLIDCLLPDDCPGCGGLRGSTDATRFCQACDEAIAMSLRPFQAPEPLQSARILGPYEGPLGAAIRRAKYRPDPGLTRELGQRLAAGATRGSPEVDEVVFVPVPWRRRLVRGFDQAEVLAAEVAAALGRPLARRLERRTSGEQAGRSATLRRTAARRAYGYRRGSAPPGRRILLVDDVLTTGATAAACADELLNAGAHEVHLLCLAASHG